MEFDPLTLWFMVISAIITIYVNFILSYWSRRGIPTPSAFNIRRLLLPIHLHDQEVYRDHGTIVGLYEGFRPTLMLGEPDLIRDILTKDFDNFPSRRAYNFGHLPDRIGLLFMKGSEEKWAKLRSVISPHFSNGKMRILTPKINECVANLLQNLSKTNVRYPVDVVEFYRAFSLDVVASTAFGISIDSMNEPKNPIVSNAKKFFGQKPFTRILFEFYLTLARLKKLRPTDFESFNYFSRLTEKITREKRYDRTRKYSGGLLNGKKVDFIQMFLNIIDHQEEAFPESIEEELPGNEEDDTLISPTDMISVFGHDCPLSSVNLKKQQESQQRKRSISLDEIKAQGILFFMAGYSGTATLLSNLSLLLAQNPRVQETLIREIDSTSQEPVNFDIINSLKYLDAAVWESLRLFPPVARVERECVADYKLAKTGIVIPSGMTVSIPVYAVHRDARNFEDPDSFVPERFLSGDGGESGLRHPWCFIPFGGGPRNCLGIRLAILETKVCIAQVLKRYRFHLEPGHQVAHSSDQVLVSPTSVLLRLEQRKEFVRTKKTTLFKRSHSRFNDRCLDSKQRLRRQVTF